jgi:hypothetical protein
MDRLFATRFATLAVWLLALPTAALAADQISLLDGRSVEATIRVIDRNGMIEGDGLEEPLALQGVRLIERSVDANENMQTAAEVYLHGEGPLRVASFELDAETLSFAWAYAAKASLPLTAVRAVVPAANAKSVPNGPELLKSVIAKHDGVDHLLIVVEGKAQDLPGMLIEWGAESISFEWNDQTRQFPLKQVYGAVFAELGEPHDSAGECEIKLADGSTASGRIVELSDATLSVAPNTDASILIPFSAVRSIRVRSDRVAFLSDEKPVEARHQPIVTLKRPWQADRAVVGSPLVLGGKTYDKGIGVQSQSELVYAVDRRYASFSAMIGLDDAAAGRGDCVFVVLVDGRERLRQRMQGRQSAQEIHVDLTGARRISLVVEPGENLDLSDYADWCDARFIRAATQ